MRVFLDTSVLVAACLSRHAHYARARPVLEGIARGEDTGFAAAHSLGECYSAFTTIPLDPRIQPLEAERLIEHNIVPHFELIDSQRTDYEAAIRRCSGQSSLGGMVYDALLLECARRSGPGRIYTFNTRHFQALAPDLAGIICAP